VLIASTSPDFPTDTSSATSGDALTWPDPRYHSDAIVLLAPDYGAGGPSGGTTPNEWYGVPSTALTRDTTGAYQSLLLYVQWDTPDGGTLPFPPGRIDYHYGGTPAWQPATTFGSGISTFTPAIDELALIVWAILLADRGGGTYLGLTGDAWRSILQVRTLLSYQGEVLVTDNTEDPPSSGIPRHYTFVDPQGVFCRGCPDTLWLYGGDNDAADGVHKTFLQRAFNVTPASLHTSLQPSVSANGDYTVFLLPSTCSTLLDVRYLFTDTSSTYTAAEEWLADHDIAILPSGRVRCSFYSNPVPTSGSGGTLPAEYGGGLVVAWGPASTCTIPDERVEYPTSDGSSPARPAPPRPRPTPSLSTLLGHDIPRLRSKADIFAFLDSIGGDGVRLSERPGPTPIEPTHPALAAATRLSKGPSHTRALAAAQRLRARSA
jgi:hypothetical protein